MKSFPNGRRADETAVRGDMRLFDQASDDRRQAAGHNHKNEYRGDP
jgi:hypothetical protein